MSKHSKKKYNLKIKDPKRLILFFVILLILVVIIITKNNTIKKKENLSLIINNNDVTQELKNEIIIKDEIEYLSFDDIKKCIDSNIYQEDEKILTGSVKKIALLELNKNEIEINGSTIKIRGQAFKTEQNTIYLPITELQAVYDIEISYIPEYKNIVLDSYSKKRETAKVNKNVFVKEEAKNGEANIEKLKKDDVVIFVSEENGWAKIRTQNGNLGFIKRNRLKDFEVQREEMQEEIKEVNNISLNKDISNKNIKKYENRKEVIEEILIQAVNKKQNAIKIIYKKDKDTEAFNRFKLEATAMLKECGITVVFE